jgi:5-methylthioadenosine/S-adenosylhomocysteine deaminase
MGMSEMGLCITNARLDGEPVALRAVDGIITALGGGVVPGDDDEVVDARGGALLPGLVNGHTHAAMTLFRSFGDDLPLMTWLETRIWPAEGRLEADDVYWGTRLACLEMIRSGTTKLVDMYWHAPDAARAIEDSGLRGVVCSPLIDQGDAANLGALQADALASLDGVEAFGDRITPFLGPHAVYTVSPASLEWIGETIAERGVGVHIHLAETRREVEDCVNAHGLRPTELLDRCGLLGPDSVLAHGCWLEPDELALIAARGATVVTNPVSNMKLAVGRQFPYLEAVQEGVAIGLGTDGAASNNSLDLFQDMKVLALAQKFASDDPSTLPAAEVLAIATGQRSALLGGRPVEVGAPADVLVVSTDRPEVAPGDLAANLVYAATGAVVDTTVVAGQVLMRDRQIDDADEIVEQVRARVPRLTDA